MLPTTFYGNQKQPLSRSNAWPTTNALENTKFPELHNPTQRLATNLTEQLVIGCFHGILLACFHEVFCCHLGSRKRTIHSLKHWGWKMSYLLKRPPGRCYVCFWESNLAYNTHPFTKARFFLSLCKHEQLERLEQPVQKQVATVFIFSNNFGMTSLHGLWLFDCWFGVHPKIHGAQFCQQMQEENPKTIGFRET